MTLTEIVDFAETTARKVMVGDNQPLMPTWLLLDKHEQLYIVGTPWRDDNEKHKTEKVLKAMVLEKEIIKYGFVTEAWKSVYSLEEVDPEDTALSEKDRPMYRPDRVEMVLICATDNLRREWRAFKTIRNKAERVTGLEPLELETAGGDMQSWMTELLA